MSSMDEMPGIKSGDPASRMAQVLHNFEAEAPYHKFSLPYDKPMLDMPSYASPINLVSYSSQLMFPPHNLHKIGEHRGVNISIEISDTFVFDSPENMVNALKGHYGPDDGHYIYSRIKNPTIEHLARYLAAMEGTERAYCTASGMSAITSLMMHLCNSGDQVVAAETIYSGSVNLFKNFLPTKCKVETTFVDITKLNEVEETIKEKKPKVLFFEPVSNPALLVADIRGLSQIAHRHGVKVVVDNTFTPMIITPCPKDPEKYHGADVVIHSLTKYVSGGADIIGGVICGEKALIDEITHVSGGALMMTGPVMNPKDAFELLGRMAHINLRVKEQSHRALELATRIKRAYEDSEKKNLEVIYPGLKDSRDHIIMNSLRNEEYGYGGVFCIDMKTKDKGFALLKGLVRHKFGFLAVSLGYFETLLSCPGAIGSEASMRLKTERAHMSPGYIRVCVGYYGNLEDKWQQFKDGYADMGSYLAGTMD